MQQDTKFFDGPIDIQFLDNSDPFLYKSHTFPSSLIYQRSTPCILPATCPICALFAKPSESERRYFHQDEQRKWYFYDETWSDLIGPYDTFADAQIHLKKYCEYLDGMLVL